MPLKFSDKPQLSYGQQQASNPWARFPQGSQHISTLPDYTPCIAIERNGQQHYGMARRGIVKKLAPFKN